MTYYIGPTITPWQRQIILGTVLGGSSIVRPKGGRNSYLSMRGKDAYWLEYKSQELKNLASPTPFLIEKNYFRWHSLCYPEFNQYQTYFYCENKKQVNMDILNELKDIGLAVWYLDGGRLDKGKIVFNTNVFKQEGTNLISQYFNEISLESETIIKNNSFRVVIVNDSVEKFFRLINHRVPAFMFGKLVEE